MKPCILCRKDKPLDEFYQDGRGGRQSVCKACWRKMRKPEHPARRRDANLKARYKLTAEQVSARLAAQDGLCAICEKPPKRIVVDHDHATNKVRAILCHRCNIGLGLVEAIGIKLVLAYLKEHA